MFVSDAFPPIISPRCVLSRVFSFPICVRTSAAFPFAALSSSSVFCCAQTVATVKTWKASRYSAFSCSLVCTKAVSGYLEGHASVALRKFCSCPWNLNLRPCTVQHDDAVTSHSLSHLKEDCLLFTMSLLDEVYRNKVAACLRALCAARYAREDNVPCQIEEGLFLGSVGVAYNRDGLKALNVTHILIVAKSLDPVYPNDFTYKKIDVLDSPDVNLEQHFDECIEFIDEAKRAGGSVLVHCFAGRSRSVTIVVTYLMKKHYMSLSQALTLVRSKRPRIAPNQGFLVQLQNFEKSLQVNQDAETS